MLLAVKVQRPDTHHRFKFCQNCLICCRHVAIFLFSKMAAAAILDLRIREILLADGVWRAQTRH